MSMGLASTVGIQRSKVLAGSGEGRGADGVRLERDAEAAPSVFDRLLYLPLQLHRKSIDQVTPQPVGGAWLRVRIVHVLNAQGHMPFAGLLFIGQPHVYLVFAFLVRPKKTNRAGQCFGCKKS